MSTWCMRVRMPLPTSATMIDVVTEFEASTEFLAHYYAEQKAPCASIVAVWEKEAPASAGAELVSGEAGERAPAREAV